MIIVDKTKAAKRWAPILDSLKVIDEEKRGWMSEYAEMHSLNENVAYNTLNINGMGGVYSPAVSTTPGLVAGSAQGSGDIAQNLLPVSMKIAAQTIGLDLVAVKPTSSPRIELLFVDFKYDNVSDQGSTFGEKDERPLLFKIHSSNTTMQTALVAALKQEMIVYGITEKIGGLSDRLFVQLSGITSYNNTNTITVTNANTEPLYTAGDEGRIAWLEFLGFSRVDGYPMFRAFRQNNNAAASGGGPESWGFVSARNTFPRSTTSVAAYMNTNPIVSVSGTTLSPVLVSTTTTGVTVELISLMEDQIEAFSAGWNNKNGMTRLQDENTYPGVVGPDVFTKAIQVGDIEISSALKRTQIEDIKASTGMDIVQKLESVLINELTQVISKQIVSKIVDLSEQNRVSNTVPKVMVGSVLTSKFDFNVDDYLSISGPAPQGETTHSIQRKLIAKIRNASNFIATDGRVGPAQYLVTNGNLASVIQDIAGYTINPVDASKMNTNGQLYPMGSIGNISIYVDPFMRWDDNRIFVGRKNSADQPGIIFIPYLMAQSVSLMSEATFAPRMLIRSRYAVADIGFFPYKQFMAIHVTDSKGVLI